MEIDHLLNVNKREMLRAWLSENHENESSCWVIISLAQRNDTILYLDAVEECLCFGWIDGIKKNIDEDKLAQRLSPRTLKTSWTELNKERVRRLEKLGLMTDAGRKVLPEMVFFPDPFIIQRLEEDERVYHNFMGFPELYRRIRMDTIQRVHKDNALYMRRLDKLIKYTRESKMYGEWHDQGRLLD